MRRPKAKAIVGLVVVQKRGRAMKISVIIPTRERLAYLRNSLATFLAIKDPELEIVVSSNAGTDGTAEFLQDIDDPRLVVANPGRRVSMRENFQCGLDHSKYGRIRHLYR